MCVVACVLSLFLEPVFADVVDAGRITNISFGTWSNSGDWSTTVSHCVLSATTNRTRPRRNDRTVYYNAKVNNRRANYGLYLYLNGDRNATGNQRILVSFEHRDLLEPTGYESLNNDQYDGHQHDGQFNGCPYGDNSELRISISSIELAGKENGYYQGRFEFYAQNDDDDDRERFNVDITVQRSTEVRISNLDPINFGQHSGLGDLLADERLCVYSSGSGAYRVSISAAHQDGGGNFYLAENLSGELIPMSVRFSDSASGSASNPILNNYFSGIGNNTAMDCGGSNNATLSVFLNETDLQAASTGHYGETLIILVEPE